MEGGAADFRLPIYLFTEAQWVSRSGPLTIRDAHAVFDESRGQLIIFGGTNTSGVYERATYLWSPAGGLGIRGATDSGPAGRTGHAMVYDAEREAVLMIGGLGEDEIDLADVWVFDGTEWTAIEAPPAAVERRRHQAMFDRERNAVVIFGGRRGLGLSVGIDRRVMPPLGRGRPGNRRRNEPGSCSVCGRSASASDNLRIVSCCNIYS